MLENLTSFIGMIYLAMPFLFVTFACSWICIIICIVLAVKSNRKFSKTFSRPIWKYWFLIVIAGYTVVFFAESISFTIDAFAIQGGSFGSDIPKIMEATHMNIFVYFPIIAVFTICYIIEFWLRSQNISEEKSEEDATCSM